MTSKELEKTYKEKKQADELLQTLTLAGTPKSSNTI